MCGICGIYSSSSGAVDRHESVVQLMRDALLHRGPDAGGIWARSDGRLAVGHRRLAILDLSPAGAQPMRSISGRYVIVFNGEIYNHAAIRRKLQQAGYSEWRGHSDTEVLLAAIECWGMEQTLQEAAGMFAFALWDSQGSVLYLARDRLGEKPLYYGWADGAFIFASELKAFYALPAWQDEVDRDALTLFLRFGYVPAPYSIFRNIRKLPPATCLTVRSPDDRNVSPIPYWSASRIAESKAQPHFERNDAAAIAALDQLLRNVVSEQMISDVPLGAFLSGGVDSSIVVALMQAQSARPIRTFTIGFHEQAFNEATEAKAVAGHLGTDHTELYVSPREAQSVIPLLPNLYDEPFADVSQIPTYLVAALARRHVTVCLSGDGGDELFGGYNRYRWAQEIWGWIGGWTRNTREMLAHGLALLTPAQWDRIFRFTALVLPRRWQQRLPGDKVHKLAEVLGVGSEKELYLALVSMWKTPATLVIGAQEPPLAGFDRVSGLGLQQQMMLWDLLTYLPDDILVKLDRASMGVSLEARVPLLDCRVVEFALGLPLDMKIRRGQTKWLLRQVLYRYVPQSLIERPKMGFGVPIGDWLRSPLRQWADDLLSEDRLQREGFLQPAPIRQKWKEHLSGSRNWQYQLWNVLMFQAWYEQRRSPKPLAGLPFGSA